MPLRHIAFFPSETQVFQRALLNNVLHTAAWLWAVTTRAQNTLNTTSPLTALEVSQVLTDVALGKRILTRSSTQSWSEIYHGLMPVEIDGWLLTFFNDCDTLDYCE